MRELLTRRRVRAGAIFTVIAALWACREIPCNQGLHVIKLVQGKRGFYLHCAICGFVIEAEGMDK